MEKLGTVVRLIVVQAMIGVGIAACAIYLLYNKAYEEKAASLLNLVKTNMVLIDAVADFDRVHSRDAHLGGASAATLEKINAAFATFGGLGTSGEIILIGESEQGESISVIVHQVSRRHDEHTHQHNDHPDSVSKKSPYARPMLAALDGRLGSMVVRDHFGESVLVAYAPIKSLGLGLIAEVSLAEIRAPFLHAAAWSALIGLALIFLGVVHIYRSTMPVIDRALESEAKFKNFAELSADWHWETDAEHRFTVIEGLEAKGAEWVASRAIGKTRQEIVDEDASSEKWRRFQTALDAHHSFRNFRYDTHSTTGEPRTVVISGSPIFDDQGEFRGYRGTGRDITDIVAGQRRLADAEERLRAAFVAVTSAMILIDEDGIIIRMNPAAEKLFGYAPEEAVGQNVSIFMPEPDSSRHDGYLKSYLRTGKAQIIGVGREVTAKRRDGELFPVHLGVAEMKLQGKRHFIGAVADLSMSKRLEDQLRQSQKMEAIGQLTGGVAHDFNNLLGIIVGNLDLATRKVEPDSKLAKYVEKALAAAKRGATLTSRLMSFARKSQTEALEVVDINDVLRNIRDLTERSITSNITVEMRLANHVLHTAINVGDLEDALINLAINARDAMPKGGVLSFTTQWRSIPDPPFTISPAIVPGEYIEIAISDTGCGIPDHVVDHIFEPFFTTKEKGKGTGLGLSMVYGFLKRSKGGISVYSEENIGTTFRIYLPAVATSIQTSVAADAEPIDISAAAGSESVLIVDDEADLAELAENVLTGLGYTTTVAHSGSAALAILNDDRRFDLLLTDVIMPGDVNGYELAKRARTMFPEMKILMMSGFEGNVIERVDPAVSNIPLLTKPYSNDELAGRVRRVLDGDSR